MNQRMGWMAFAAALLLAGCVETDFDYKTTVRPDGSVERRVRVDGRGGSLFVPPKGKNWEVKSWKSEKGGTLIPDTVHHIRAKGRFEPGEPIGHDYEYDVSRLADSWDDDEKKRLEKLGITPPYEKHFFSRNEISVNQIKGWLTVTTFYEESFHTNGFIEVLLDDLKGEVREDAAKRGETFSEAEVETLARLRLSDEILSIFRFKSQVEMPGKIISTNGRLAAENTASWDFSMKDFDEEFTRYKLQAASRSYRLPVFVLFSGIGALLLLSILIGAIGMARYGRHLFGPDRPRPKRGSPPDDLG